MSGYVPKFQPGAVVTFTAEGPITAGQVVEVGAAGRSVKVAGAASVKAIGRAAFDAIAGDKVSVHLCKAVHTAKTAAAVAVGAKVEAGAAGTVQTATTGTVLGTALTAGAAGATIEYVQA